MSKLVCLFVAYSFWGWMFESVYCTITKGRWQKRGFLYGPLCPIYGVGAVLISFLTDHLPPSITTSRWVVFLIAFFGSMILEFVTSWVLEVLFHAVWWDYSHVPLNVRGRTSVPTSIGFGIAGIVVVDYMEPRISRVADAFSMIQTECIALLLVAVFSADLTLTVSALTNFARIVAQMDDAVNLKMENLVESAQRKSLEMRQRAALDSMGELRRMALKRVSDFRYPSLSKERLRHLLSSIRKNNLPPQDGQDEQPGDDF